MAIWKINTKVLLNTLHTFQCIESHEKDFAHHANDITMFLDNS